MGTVDTARVTFMGESPKQTQPYKAKNEIFQLDCLEFMKNWGGIRLT